MNTGLTESDIQVIQDTLNSFTEIESAILFGSRAKGTYKKGSDIDIAIRFSIDSPNKGVHLIHVKFEEETPLPYFFDVVDLNSIQNKDLIDHIKRVGIPLTPKINPCLLNTYKTLKIP